MKIIGKYQNMMIGLQNNQLYHKSKDQENWAIAMPQIPENRNNESLVYHYIFFCETMNINVSHEFVQ